MTAAEEKLSYDPKSLTRDDSVVDVWSRFEPVADERIREMKHWVRFDCVRKRMKLLRTITIYHDGSVVELPQKNKFEAIEPGSNPAFLSDEVCGEKKEPQPAPQEPVIAPVEKPLQEVQPVIAPVQAVPQEPVIAPVEKPLHEGPPPAAPQPSVSQEPATVPGEKRIPEVQQTPAAPQQNTAPPEMPPLAPASLPQ